MAVDASIPLSVKTPQLDLGAIIGEAMKLKQLQQQVQTDNALKQILAQPDAIDQKTGLPTTNTLAQISKAAPAAGMKMIDQVAQVQERQAQKAHAESETQTARQKAYRETLSTALGVYDADVASGNTDPKEAERSLKTTLHDQLFGDASLSPELRDKNWALVEKMSPAQLRAMTLSADQREKIQEKEREETQERTPAVMGGKPVMVDKQGGVHDPNTGEKLKVTGPIEKEGTSLDPQRLAMEQRRLALQEKAAQGSAADLTEDDLKFAGSIVANGQPMPNMGYGAAGAKARAKILHYAAQQASEEAGSPEAGGAGVVVRKDTLAADKAALQQSEKQLQSVRQFSQTATSLADKIDAMKDRVTTPGGPPLIAKAVIAAKTGVFGDAETREFLGYITDLQSENAKIMAGATGSVAQVSAHNQEMMNDILSGRRPATDISGALKSIREGIKLRNASVSDEVQRQRDQMKADTSHGAGGTHDIPKDLLDTYGKITDPAKKETAKARLKAAGYDVSGLK